jgi:signal transduction histidine kinase
VGKRLGVKEREDKPTEKAQHIAKHLSAHMRLSAIGQLAAGVAHELNNPLSVILGFSQSMMQQPREYGELLPSLKAIEREAQRCKRLVRDLLNFSRLPRPGKVMEDVLQVLEGALSLVEAQTRIGHVELVRDFSKSLPAVYLDRHRIQQLVINLCTNAIDAMPKGGCLTIRVSPFVGTEKLFWVEIQVRDTGKGIPTNIKDHIFEPFFTTKESNKGTGLGLSLVQAVVLEHEGQLEVDSQINRGTTFTVRLPAAQKWRAPAAKNI